MSASSFIEVHGTAWSPEQTLEWMEAFRSLILETASSDGEQDAYERVRRSDPMRQVRFAAIQQ
ncbi:MAG: hypothetical protein ABI330_19670 [Caldimonas sp.]|nr:hypothetical protein [Pseudomonadota bacterium]